jgi:hypothetical protein
MVLAGLRADEMEKERVNQHRLDKLCVPKHAPHLHLATLYHEASKYEYWRYEKYLVDTPWPWLLVSWHG